MLYIQNNKTVKEYYTSSKVEKAIETLLKRDENLMSSETFEGYKVKIVEDKEGD